MIAPWMLTGVVLALAVTGCSSAAQADLSATTSATSSDDRAIVLAYQGQVSSLDPVSADYSQTNHIDQALYDTLITFDSNNTIVGQLATEFVQSPDTTSIQVTLRDDVNFHDGTKLTAEDVKYTLDRISSLGKGINSQLAGYSATQIEDDAHLTIELSEPNSLFLGALSKVYILNSALVEANAGTDQAQAYLAQHDAGSGSYSLAGAPTGEDFTLQRYDDYFAFDAARPETLVFRRIDESATQRAEVAAGTLDLTFGLSVQDTASLEGTPGVSISSEPVSLQANIFFNLLDGPTANPAVREAVRLAYDYGGGLATIRGGQGVPATGPLPTTFTCRPDTPAFQQNLDQARATLQQAGISDLTLTMKYQPVFKEQEREATLLQSNLAEIGVTLNLEPITYPDYLTSLANPATIPQMMLATDFAQFPDPGVMLIKTYKSDELGTNKSGYSNPQVDAWLTEALATSDADQRCELYKQAQVQIIADAVAVNMYSLTLTVAYSDRITGVGPAIVGDEVWIPNIRLAS